MDEESREEELVSLIVEVSRTLRYGVNKWPSQLSTLLLLEIGNKSQKELLKTLSITPASLSEIIKKLEKKELIEKKRSTKDKRIYELTLTDKGKNLLKEVREIERKGAFSSLTEKEKDSLTFILKKLISSWSEEK